MTSSTTETAVTPGTADTAWVTRLVIVSRMGQPATVRYTSTRTAPSAAIWTSLTMPSSVSGRLISGSWTVARAAVTASSAGEPVSVSDMVAWGSFDGGTRSAGQACQDIALHDRIACHCTAGPRGGPAAEGDLSRRRLVVGSPECPPLVPPPSGTPSGWGSRSGSTAPPSEPRPTPPG